MLQLKIWYSSDLCKVSKQNFEEYGWMSENNVLIPKYSTNDCVPDVVRQCLNLICSDKNCNNKKCSCIKENLKCCSDCKCKTCTNTADTMNDSNSEDLINY